MGSCLKLSAIVIVVVVLSYWFGFAGRYSFAAGEVVERETSQEENRDVAFIVELRSTDDVL